MNCGQWASWTSLNVYRSCYSRNVCVFVWLGLWQLRCAPPHEYVVHHRAALCTMVYNAVLLVSVGLCHFKGTEMHCAPSTCIVHVVHHQLAFWGDLLFWKSHFYSFLVRNGAVKQFRSPSLSHLQTEQYGLSERVWLLHIWPCWQFVQVRVRLNTHWWWPSILNMERVY